MGAAGLFVVGGVITFVVVARQIAPRMMRGMMQSMMKEMMNSKDGFDPPEMCKKMMAELMESEKQKQAA